MGFSNTCHYCGGEATYNVELRKGGGTTRRSVCGTHKPEAGQTADRGGFQTRLHLGTYGQILRRMAGM